jgi:hypothetical protein
VPAGKLEKKENRKVVHFRFEADLNELLEAACKYLGATKTQLVEDCIRLNLDKVVAAEELRRAGAAKAFKKVRSNTSL